MDRKSTLTYYKNKNKPGPEKIYDGSYDGVLMFKARTGSLKAYSRTYT